MKYSEVKDIYENLEAIGFDTNEIREAIDSINMEMSDFEAGNYRIIDTSEIDHIQCEELENNPYTLGCFNDWFIADVTDLSIDIVQALQEAGKYEAIGQHIIDNDYMSDIQQEYSRLDGYGHHFAHYDHQEHELYANGIDYLVFKVN